jgi:UDP-2,3-diacylglucosamine pyrophosphatase LpxH
MFFAILCALGVLGSDKKTITSDKIFLFSDNAQEKLVHGDGFRVVLNAARIFISLILESMLFLLVLPLYAARLPCPFLWFPSAGR